MLNLTNKTAYHQFDEHGMLIVPTDELSWKDSVGRTTLAWIAYERPVELVKSLDDCMDFNRKKHKWEVFRHPEHKEKSSRDHWSYMLIHLKLYNPYWLKEVVEWKFIPRMRGMNLWMKSLTGNKRAEWWYYFWAIPFARIGNGFLRFCRWVGRIGPERCNNWWIHNKYYSDLTGGGAILYNRTKWQKAWAWIIFQIIPAYPLHNKAWQIYVMRKTPKRDALRKILIKRIGKSNILMRLLLGDAVTQQEVDNYPHMTGYRPGVYLDETCRRTIRELTVEEAEFNTYEKDLIQWLYLLSIVW